MSLMTLIDAGLLQPGERLYITDNVRGDGRILLKDQVAAEGVVTKDGGILVGGVAYWSPGAAAKAALKRPNVNGWERWFTYRLGRDSLSELRDLWNNPSLMAALRKSPLRIQYAPPDGHRTRNGGVAPGLMAVTRHGPYSRLFTSLNHTRSLIWTSLASSVTPVMAGPHTPVR